VIMYVWYKGRKLKNQFLTFVPMKNYLNIIKDLSRDESVPKYATNLIYTTRANRPGEIEMKIISSILNKQPKRADMYWFLHVDIMDEPDTLDYKITQYIPGVIIKVDFRIGFKIVPRLNLFFKRVFEELVINNEIDGLSRYESLQKHRIVGDCRFVLINRVTNPDFDLPGFDQLIMDISEFLKSISLSEVKFLGLDTSAVTIEQVPLAVGRAPFVASPEITRVYK
jgi:KUP system potassium uptake protein